MTPFDFLNIQEDLPIKAPASAASDLSFLKTLSFDDLIQRFATGIVTLAINIAAAIIVFYAGRFVIKKIYALIGRIMLRRGVDSSLMTFVLSFVKITLYFILIVTVIGILGIETSSFLALFASAGVAIGMALSGTLQNFAGGVLILLLKPYRVGHYIEAQGFEGTVKEIQIFHTIIVTYDNKAITIPNGPLSTGSINNWHSEPARRVDWSVGISYGDSVETAREAILAIINADPRVLHPSAEEGMSDNSLPRQWPPDIFTLESALAAGKERNRRANASRLRSDKTLYPPRQNNPTKEPTVVVASLADSAVVLKARAWVKTKDYWDVFYDIYEQIYTHLPESGVTFPFPQLDVHFDSTTPTIKNQPK